MDGPTSNINLQKKVSATLRHHRGARTRANFLLQHRPVPLLDEEAVSISTT